MLVPRGTWYWEDLCNLRREEPQVGLHGKFGVQVAELLGEQWKSLPVKISAGKEWFTSMECEGDAIIPELFQPGDNIPDCINTHFWGSRIRTPAVAAVCGTTKGRDEHHMEWIFHAFVYECPFSKMLTVFFFLSKSLKRQ